MRHHVLDVRRMLCPLPVIRTQDAIKDLKTGDRLEVVCTDPGALHDVPTWCRVHGHAVLETQTRDHEITILIEVCGRA